MKSKQFTIDKWLLIASLVIIVSFVAIISRYNIVIDDEIRSVTLNEAEDISKQIQLSLAGEIEENIEDVSLLAEHAKSMNVTTENAAAFLKSQSQIAEFENVYYISSDGIGISSNGKQIDFSKNITYERALKGELFIDTPYISAETGKDIVSVAIPVQEGEAPAVIFAECALGDVYQYITNIMSTSGYAFILDEEGKMVFNTRVNSESTDAQKREGMELYNSEDMVDIQDELAMGMKGNHYYQSEETKNIAVYSPIEHTTWSVVINVNSEGINKGLSDAIATIISASMFVVILLIIYAAYAGYSKVSSLKEIEKSAYYDPLTNLPNLAKYKKDVANILQKNKNVKYSVIKIDVENFKAVNEMFGFEIGNRVLQAFKTIRETVNEPTLMIARVGIDEFLLFSGNGFLDDMEQRTHIYESYYQELIPELGNYRITFKYGRYSIALGETNVDDIVTKVNMAHQIAKDKKGYIIYDYDDNYKRELLEVAEITNKMKDALTNSEFKVYLQPKFSVKESKLVGAEALVRWIEEDGNMIYPNQFIPLFEKNGFIVELDKYMIKETCKIIKKWYDNGEDIVPISVNCSRLNLENPLFVQEIAEIADDYGVPHQYIEIELTESTIIENEEILQKLFTDLHKVGFKVSIDDFGSGYSSLGLLKNLRVDALKLDRSFFVDSMDQARGDLVVDGIIKLAQNLNMYVVAEGIEEESQVRFLKQVNCNAIQGYYFAKPMPSSEFESNYYNSMKRV